MRTTSTRFTARRNGRRRPTAEDAARARSTPTPSALIGDIPELSEAERGDELVVLRRDYLRRQLQALRARVRMLQGARFTFDEESRALYDAVAPVHPESYFAATLNELERLLPGEAR